MSLVRRITAIALLASFAGSQPASLGCAMGSVPDDAAASFAAAQQQHAHHAPAADAGAESARTDGPSETRGSEGCGLMMPCTIAAPSPNIAAMPPAMYGAAATVSSPDGEYAAPSLAFEPPPPRQSLI